MRIISGKKRGLRLAAVGKGDLAAHLRPTSDRVRESIFNLLMGGAYGDPITGARVLDLFAGTGALGLEAWSRGAARVTFVDDGATALALLRQNLNLCGAQGDIRTIRRNATRLGPCTGQPFDLVFLDPPYGKGLGEMALTGALGNGWLARRCIIICEENSAIPPPPGFRRLDQRRYGATHITILQPEPAP